MEKAYRSQSMPVSLFASLAKIYIFTKNKCFRDKETREEIRMPSFFKDRKKPKKGNAINARFNGGANYSNLEALSHVGMVVDEKDMIAVSKKQSTPRNPFQKKAGKDEIKKMDFYVTIDLLDGIIVTNSGSRKKVVKDGMPVFAVASYKKKIAGIPKSVTTNIPSCQLKSHPSSIGNNRERYFARFADEIQDRSHTFKLSAPMLMQKGITKSRCEPREVEFQIGLMKGSQVIYLGSATLTLQGDEQGKRQSIPVKSKKPKKSGVKRNMKKESSVNMISASFTDTPGCKYSLQRSMLRVSVSTDSNLAQAPDGVGHISVNITQSLSYLSGLSFDMASSTGSLSSEEEIAFSPYHKQKNGHMLNLSSTQSEMISDKYNIPETSFEFDGISESTGTSASRHTKHSFTASSDEDDEDDEDDESALLEDVSIGTIKWKDEF
jgi:hypothetical protein